MQVKFPDGRIEVIISTGYIGKSNTHPEKKGAHWIGTNDAMYWSTGCEIFKNIKILGYINLKQKKRTKYFKKSF